MYKYQPSGPPAAPGHGLARHGDLNRRERPENAKNSMDRALALQRQFTSDASHELRTPLAGLRAQLEEARMHPDETDLSELLGWALRDIDRLQVIITDLLLLTELRENVPSALEEVDLAEMVRTEMSLRSDRLPVRLRLTPAVTVDGVDIHLTRALTNLLDNAQRHADKTVQVEVHRNGAHAELVVTDDGEGIAEADRERIFAQFVRLDGSRSRDRGGTGLGLAIVHSIARAHGGTIEVGVSDTGGARFALRLPLAEITETDFTDLDPPALAPCPVR